MKKTALSLSIALLMFTSTTYSQAPQSLNYQGIARNANGSAALNQFISVEISIRDGSSSAPIVYQEIDTTTTNQFGLFTVAIGTGQLQSGNFTTINWATGNKYIQVGFDPSGGQNFINMGVSELLSVPYALYAQSTAPKITHQIGDLYQGGIIVSVWRDSTGAEHGLIASLTDVSDSSVWSNVTSTLIGAAAENPSNGAGNTTAIIAQSGQTTSAALLCQNYTAGGYSDWYLPAIWELQQCYNAAMIVNQVLGNTNGFQFGLYWSSTEFSSTVGGTESFTFGYATNFYSKGNAYSVRAVRRY